MSKLGIILLFFFSLLLVACSNNQFDGADTNLEGNNSNNLTLNLNTGINNNSLNIANNSITKIKTNEDVSSTLYTQSYPYQATIYSEMFSEKTGAYKEGNQWVYENFTISNYFLKNFSLKDSYYVINDFNILLNETKTEELEGDIYNITLISLDDNKYLNSVGKVNIYSEPFQILNNSFITIDFNTYLQLITKSNVSAYFRLYRDYSYINDISKLYDNNKMDEQIEECDISIFNKAIMNRIDFERKKNKNAFLIWGESQDINNHKRDINLSVPNSEALNIHSNKECFNYILTMSDLLILNTPEIKQKGYTQGVTNIIMDSSNKQYIFSLNLR